MKPGVVAEGKACRRGSRADKKNLLFTRGDWAAA